MTYRNLIAATIVVTVCILAGSNAMAQRHGGFSGGGFRGGGGAFAILATHSFTIPIRITHTIPTDIILTITNMIPTPNLFTKTVPDIPTL